MIIFIEIFSIILQRLIAIFSFLLGENRIIKFSEQPVESSPLFSTYSSSHHKLGDIWKWLSIYALHCLDLLKMPHHLKPPWLLGNHSSWTMAGLEGIDCYNVSSQNSWLTFHFYKNWNKLIQSILLVLKFRTGDTEVSRHGIKCLSNN